MQQNKFVIAALFGLLRASSATETEEDLTCSTLNGEVVCNEGTELRSEWCDWNVQRMDGESNSAEQWNKWAAQTQYLWHDWEFPADDSSLLWDPYFGDGGQYKPPLGQLVWKRPNEMGAWDGVQYRKRPTLWGENGYPHPNGFAQGNLGDCWFLAAAAAVAEQPQLLQGIFFQDDLLVSGMARVSFWVKDRWVGVNIDDRVPSIDHGGVYRPWAVRPGIDGSWWMPILEKAYAKLDVNYDRIAGGWGKEGLRTLTGQPTHNVWLENVTKRYMEPIHQYWASKNFPMTAACCRTANGLNDRQGGVAENLMGLIPGHAYTVLDVVDLVNSRGRKQHTIIKIRNPWATDTWNGPWRDDDPNWTRSYRNQVGGHSNSNDGQFWMDYNWFLANMYNTGVAITEDWAGYVVKQKRISANQDYRMTFSNPRKQHVYVTAEIDSGRHYPRKNCSPGEQLLVYLYDSQWNQIGDYQWLYNENGGEGFVTMFNDPLNEPLPKASTYRLRVINYKGKSSTVTFEWFFADKTGKVKM